MTKTSAIRQKKKQENKSKTLRKGCFAHLESLLAVLQVQAVRTVPVAINYIRLSVAVKVGERHTSAVLISVFNSCHHDGRH